MTENDDIWAIIARVLEENPMEGDLEKLGRWRDADPENEKLFREVADLWQKSREEADANLNKYRYSKTDWKKVEARVHANRQNRSSENVTKYRKIRKRHKGISIAAKAASLLVVAILSAWLAIQYSSTPQNPDVETVYNEFRTAQGEKASIQLSDGTEVSLSADTGLSVPNPFGRDKREITLDGHAFFDVASNPARPFLIHTKNGVIEVLGTSFDVRSYSDEKDVDIVVRAGVVQITHLANPENSAIINAGYRGKIKMEEQDLLVEWAENLDDYFGWLDGRLIFKQRPLSYVFRQLERWYNLQIEIPDAHKDILEKEFTADLKTRSAEDVLDLIQFTMGVQYSMDENRVLITPANDAQQ